MSKAFGAGLSEAADWRRAAAEAASAARASLGPGPCDLALVFVSEGKDAADPRAVIEAVSRELSPRRLLGGNAGGAIGGRREVEDACAVSVLAMRLPGARPHAFSLTPAELARLEDGRALVAALDVYPTESPKFLAVGDPASCDAERLTALLNQGYPGAPLVGGLGGAPQRRRPAWALLDGDVVDHGTAAVALTGGVEVDVVVAQGCRPIGEPLTVTRAEGNLLKELGGRPPVEVLRETLSRCSPEDRRLARHSLFAGLAMSEGRPGYRRGDFLVRNVLGLDQESGALAVGARLRAGQTLQFQLRDAHTSDVDLQDLLGRLPEGGAAPRGALLVACAGRGKGLYGEPDHDASLVQSMRGPLPLAGFFANGEFGPVDGRNHVHGYTASLAVFR